MVSRGSVAVLLAFVAYVFGHTDIWTMVVGGTMCWRLCDEIHGCRRLIYDSTNQQCLFETEHVNNKNEPCGSGSCKSEDICLETRTSEWRLVKTIIEGKQKDEASMPDAKHLLILPFIKNRKANGYRLNLATKRTDKFLCVWVNLRSAVYLTKTSKFLIVRRHELIIANDLNDTGRRILTPKQAIWDFKADEDRDMMFLTYYECKMYTGTLNGKNLKLLFKVAMGNNCFITLNSEDKKIYIGVRRKIYVFTYKGKKVRALSPNVRRIYSLIYVPSQKAVFCATGDTIVKVSMDRKTTFIAFQTPRRMKGWIFSMTFHATTLYMSLDEHVGHIYSADVSGKSNTPFQKLKFANDSAVGGPGFILTLM